MSDRGDTVTKIVEAGLRCCARYGIRKTTIEDIAREAGVSRATLYRYFDGKDAVIRGVIILETSRLFNEFQARTREVSDIAELLTEATLFFGDALSTHEVLNKVLETEPELLMVRLTTDAMTVIGFMSGSLMVVLEKEARMGKVSSDRLLEKSEWLSRMILTELTTGGMGVGITDRQEVRAWVGRRLMPALGAISPA